MPFIDFYGQDLSPDEQEALVEAATLEGIDREIGVLRVLIRRVVNAGDVREARRYVETLCRALRARHALDQQAADQLATSLERVLDSIGGELGVSL